MTIFDYQQSNDKYKKSKKSKKSIDDEWKIPFVEDSKCKFTGMKIGDDRTLLFIFDELKQYSVMSGPVKDLDQSKNLFNYLDNMTFNERLLMCGVKLTYISVPDTDKLQKKVLL